MVGAAGGSTAIGVLLGHARLVATGRCSSKWLALMANSIARLQLGPDGPNTVARLVAAAASNQAAAALTPQELAMLLHAAAAVGADVPPSARRHLLQRLQALVEARLLQAGHWGLVSWALARLVQRSRWRVGRERVRMLCRGMSLEARVWRVQQQQQQQGRDLPWQQQREQQRPNQQQHWRRRAALQVHGQQWRVREACRLLWAMAALRHRPSSSFLRAWQRRAAEAMPLFTSADLASSTWALGRFASLSCQGAATRLPLCWQWQRAWARVTGPRLPSLSPRECALLLWGAGAAGAAPPRGWVLRAAQLAARQLKQRAWKGEEAAMGMWGLSRLRADRLLDAEALELLLAQLTAATAGDLPQLRPRALLQLLHAAAALDPALRPEGRWRRQRWRGRARGASLGSGWVSVGSASSSSSIDAGDAAVGAVAAAAAAFAVQSGTLLSRELISARLAAKASESASERAKQHSSIDPRWLQRWIAVVHAQADSWPPQLLAEALVALARTGAAPPPQWQQRVLRSLLQRREEGRLAARDAAGVTWALAAMRSPLLREWRARCIIQYRAGRLDDAGHRFEHVAGVWQFGAPGGGSYSVISSSGSRRVQLWRHGHGVAAHALRARSRAVADERSSSTQSDSDTSSSGNSNSRSNSGSGASSGMYLNGSSSAAANRTAVVNGNSSSGGNSNSGGSTDAGPGSEALNARAAAAAVVTSACGASSGPVLSFDAGGLFAAVAAAATSVEIPAAISVSLQMQQRRTSSGSGRV